MSLDPLKLTGGGLLGSMLAGLAHALITQFSPEFQQVLSSSGMGPTFFLAWGAGMGSAVQAYLLTRKNLELTRKNPERLPSPPSETTAPEQRQQKPAWLENHLYEAEARVATARAKTADAEARIAEAKATTEETHAREAVHNLQQKIATDEITLRDRQTESYTKDEIAKKTAIEIKILNSLKTQYTPEQLKVRLEDLTELVRENEQAEAKLNAANQEIERLQKLHSATAHQYEEALATLKGKSKSEADQLHEHVINLQKQTRELQRQLDEALSAKEKATQYAAFAAKEYKELKDRARKIEAGLDARINAAIARHLPAQNKQPSSDVAQPGRFSLFGRKSHPPQNTEHVDPEKVSQVVRQIKDELVLEPIAPISDPSSEKTTTAAEDPQRLKE